MRYLHVALGCLLAMVCLAATAQSRPIRVGVVLAMEGVVSVHRNEGDVRGRRTPLKVLAALNEKDKIYVPAGGKITISVLTLGSRFVISGPVEDLEIPPKGAFQAKKNIQEIKLASREGIVASNAVDLSTMGGGSGRALAQIHTEMASPRLHLDVLPEGVNATTTFLYRPTQSPRGPWVAGNATVVGRQDTTDANTVLQLEVKLTPGQDYELNLGSQPPTGPCQFWIHCYSDQDLSGLRQVEQAAQDTAGMLEYYESCLNRHLFDRAEAVLRKLQAASPSALDYKDAFNELHKLRRQGQQAYGHA